MRVLLVEDDELLGDGIRTGLKHYGHTVDWVKDGQSANNVLISSHENFDMVVLDLGLPKLSGLDLLKNIRERNITTPVVILTAKETVDDRVSGLDAGADDYLTKPFVLEELQARVKALLRRSDRAPVGTSNHHEILSYGPLTLVPERFEAIWFDSPVRLTHLEFELLHCLLQRHGQTVAPSLILKEVWGYEPDDDIETIRVHVRHLRTKLEPDPRKPRFIKTVYGAGYCLELPTGGQLEGMQDVIAMARENRKQQGDRASA